MAERQNKSLEDAGCRQRVTANELEEQINWILKRFGDAITDTGILLDILKWEKESYWKALKGAYLT